MASYCDFCNSHPEDTFNTTYHNTQYGFPLEEDNLLFERLVLEINQAGLSWITILKKADYFHEAYHGFNIEKVAKYGEKDRARLLADAGIIRNKLKVNAAIVNAGIILELRKEFGSFKGWLDTHHPLTKEEWTKSSERLSSSRAARSSTSSSCPRVTCQARTMRTVRSTQRSPRSNLPG